MKSKHAFLFSLIFIPICSALRILQYIFVIDRNGYYAYQSDLGTSLTYALYAALAVTAASAFVFAVAGSRKKIGGDVFKGSFSGVLLIASAALMLVDFGISAAAMLKNSAFDAAAVLELLAAVYLASAGYTAVNASHRTPRILGLFLPIYIVVYAVKEFFASFEKVHISQIKLDMLAICTTALLFITLFFVFSGFPITMRRFTASLLLCSVFVSTSSAAGLYAAAANKISADSPIKLIIRYVVQLLLAALTLKALARADRCICEEDGDGIPEIEVEDTFGSDEGEHVNG